MTDTNEQSDEHRQRLLSASQAGWALTLATVVSLLVGVVVVGGLGGGSAPPLEIDGTSQPVTAPTPQFHILERDADTQANGTPSSIRRTEWVESMFLPRPATSPAPVARPEIGVEGQPPASIAREPQRDVLR